MANGDAINTLFAQFTRLRQTGWTRDNAWDKIEPEALKLDPRDRDRLLALLRSWEAKNGRNYQASPNPDPYETHYAPPDGLDAVRKQHRADQKPEVPEPPQPPEPGENAPNVRRIRRIQSGSQPETPPEQPPQQSAQSGETCPKCGAVNRAGELFCQNCGSAMAGIQAQVGSTQRLGDELIDTLDTAFFGENMVVVLKVQGHEQPIRAQPRNAELVIGRRSPESVMIPDVDLSPYGAAERGVSRLHAALKRHGTTLVLTDMGSLNHTHINGQRIHAHEVRVLHDGDELQFGQMRVNVYFEQG